MSKKIQLKKVRPNAILPRYATEGAGALDLHACIPEPQEVQPGETVLIPTGISVNIANKSLTWVLAPRSGLGHKHGLVLGNAIGVIDSDYLGEIFISAWNRNPVVTVDGRSSKAYVIQPGERIAQAMFVPVVHVEFEEVDEFSTATARGNGGFGSTGS